MELVLYGIMILLTLAGGLVFTCFSGKPIPAPVENTQVYKPERIYFRNSSERRVLLAVQLALTCALWGGWVLAAWKLFGLVGAFGACVLLVPIAIFIFHSVKVVANSLTAKRERVNRVL